MPVESRYRDDYLFALAHAVNVYVLVSGDRDLTDLPAQTPPIRDASLFRSLHILLRVVEPVRFALLIFD